MTSIVIAPLLLVMMQINYFSDRDWRCAIRTTDSLGAELTTHIFIHRDATSNGKDTDNIYVSDKHGHLNTSLPAGLYDVCVTASSFSPQCRKIVVKDHDVDLKFKLNVSEEITKRFGDQFSN